MRVSVQLFTFYDIQYNALLMYLILIAGKISIAMEHRVVVAVVLVLAFAVICGLLACAVNYWPQMRHNQVWLGYSSSLPDYVPHFLGRDQEIADLVKLLDPGNGDIKTVSIVGPPGFGKSSLATHVGHEMIDKGVVVNYVDLDEVELDGLPEKIIGNAGIATKNDSVERLIKWAKHEVSFPVLLILDNCDVVLHEKRAIFENILEKILRNSPRMKILLTSKQKRVQLDQFAEFSLEEINPEASCKLLSGIARRKVSKKSCRSIIQLTGNVPLAVKVIGAILSKGTRNVTHVVESLRKEFSHTINYDGLPVNQKVNASISVSYKYLTERQRKLGKQLAYFPGSFTVQAACQVLSHVIESCDSVRAELDVFEQRSLLQHQGKNRYQFHKILKEFFSDMESISNSDTHSNKHNFLANFQKYFGSMLFHFSLEFEKNYVAALNALDTEKHNIQFYLRHVTYQCSFDPEHSLSAIRIVQVALNKRFLTCRFKGKDLLQPLNSINTCVMLIGKRAQSTEKHLTLRIFIDITLKMHDLASSSRTQENILESANRVLEKFEDNELPDTTTFYSRLGSHYRVLGDHEKERKCHEKILWRAGTLWNQCSPGSCDYHAISIAYFSLERYTLSAYFIKLSLKEDQPQLSDITMAAVLYRLYVSQLNIGEEVEARSTFDRLESLFPSLHNASLSEVYSHLDLFSQLAKIFRANGMTDQARQLEIKQIMAVKTINATELRYEETVTEKATALAVSLFEQKQYTEVPDMAKVALDLLSKQKWCKQIIDLQLILGKAEYHNGNETASVEMLKLVACSIIYDHPIYKDTAREACMYLVAQSRFDYACLIIIWDDIVLAGKGLLSALLADTVDKNYFSIPKEQKASTSSDVILSSSYLDILPYDLAAPTQMFYTTIINWVIQCLKRFFSYLLSYNFIILCINRFFVFTKFLIVTTFLICCCGLSTRCVYRVVVRFVKGLYRIFQKCIRIVIKFTV